jgi:hypothetical protein
MIAKSGKTQLSANDLALLGAGKIGYIRKMRSEDVSARFPEAPELDPGLELWALFGADGTPILLTDNRSSTFYPRRRGRIEDRLPALIAPRPDRPEIEARKSIGFPGFSLWSI